MAGSCRRRMRCRLNKRVDRPRRANARELQEAGRHQDPHRRGATTRTPPGSTIRPCQPEQLAGQLKQRSTGGGRAKAAQIGIGSVRSGAPSHCCCNRASGWIPGWPPHQERHDPGEGPTASRSGGDPSRDRAENSGSIQHSDSKLINQARSCLPYVCATTTMHARLVAPPPTPCTNRETR